MTPTTDRLSRLSVRLRSLSVFRALLDDPVVSALCAYLDCRGADTVRAVDAYAVFAARLYETHTECLSEYIAGIAGDDENCYIRAIGAGECPSNVVISALYEDLATLQEVAALTPQILCDGIGYDGALPEFAVQPIDLTDRYMYRVQNIGRYGYGIYARYHMFYLEGARIVPVRNPDGTRLADLTGYEREKALILDNTRALIAGKPAANILLTGDAGTGKSSTVKAVANELWQQGLRILEVRKEQLREIPFIVNELAENPLKFILFIDDLSFAGDDDDYSALKAMLEGSVSAKSANVVIYATSNRRHLLKESFSDREGDDVHFNDTMQQIVSLSERFGMQITFARPDKAAYLDIVRHLARSRGIPDDDALIAAAERFALRRGSRSARAAKQLVDALASGVGVE